MIYDVLHARGVIDDDGLLLWLRLLAFIVLSRLAASCPSLFFFFPENNSVLKSTIHNIIKHNTTVPCATGGTVVLRGQNYRGRNNHTRCCILPCINSTKYSSSSNKADSYISTDIVSRLTTSDCSCFPSRCINLRYLVSTLPSASWSIASHQLMQLLRLAYLIHVQSRTTCTYYYT